MGKMDLDFDAIIARNEALEAFVRGHFLKHLKAGAETLDPDDLADILVRAPFLISATWG